VVHTMVRDDECNEKQQPGSELLHAYIPRVSVLGEPGLPLPVWLKLCVRCALSICASAKGSVCSLLLFVLHIGP